MIQASLATADQSDEGAGGGETSGERYGRVAAAPQRSEPERRFFRRYFSAFCDEILRGAHDPMAKRGDAPAA